MHALVIDDTRTMRLLLRSVLQKLGFQVSEAGNGLEGLERLRSSEGVDVVLVDWQMPEMDGLEFVSSVRSSGTYAGLRMVVVTGETSPDFVERVVAAGADTWLNKPFTPEGVRQRLGAIGMLPVSSRAIQQGASPSCGQARDAHADRC